MSTVISRLEKLETAVREIKLFIQHRVLDGSMVFEDVMDGLYREISSQERQMEQGPYRNFPGKKYNLPSPEGALRKKKKSKKGKKKRTNRS